MSAQEPSLRLILTTFSDESEAEPIVRQLLSERLIACGTLLPGARSLYHWKGVLEEASEVIVLLKTESAIASRCMERLAELHPYETPEIIQLDPETVYAPYAAWVKETSDWREEVGLRSSPAGASGVGAPEFKL